MDSLAAAAEPECVNEGIVEAASSPATMLIITTGIIGIAFSLWLLSMVAAVKLDVTSVAGSAKTKDSALQNTRLEELYNAITLGASSFLTAEYKLCAAFVVVVFPCMWFSIGALSGVSFVVGAVTSMISGLIGMKVAVFSNARCTVGACSPTVGWTNAFNTAFRAGGVMGFSLTGLALLSIYALMIVLKEFVGEGKEGTIELMECLAGFGLGGSCIAMFGRVGGGIYTKAADVVGDLAGMGSDLFGSFAEGTCAAFVVGAASVELAANWYSIMFPLVISALGLIVCLACSFLATDISPVRKQQDVETVLKVQLASTSVVMTAVLYPICKAFLPATFTFVTASSDMQSG